MSRWGLHADSASHATQRRHSHAQQRRMMKFGNFLQQTNFPSEQVNQLWISSFPWRPKQRDSYLAEEKMRGVGVGWLHEKWPRRRLRGKTPGVNIPGLPPRSSLPEATGGCHCMCTTGGLGCAAHIQEEEKEEVHWVVNIEGFTRFHTEMSTPRIARKWSRLRQKSVFSSFNVAKLFWRMRGKLVQAVHVCFLSLLIGLRC